MARKATPKKAAKSKRKPNAAFMKPLSPRAVDAFYKAALISGGTDNGKPGLRPQYGPTYYAAFVIDPDGYHLEAVITE